MAETDQIYLKVEHLTKVMKQQVILKDINLELNKGFIYGFRGKTDPEKQCYSVPYVD